MAKEDSCLLDTAKGRTGISLLKERAASGALCKLYGGSSLDGVFERTFRKAMVPADSQRARKEGG